MVSGSSRGPRLWRWQRWAWAISAVGLGLLWAGPVARAQFGVGFQDFGLAPPGSEPLAYRAVQATGSGWMRVTGSWSGVAPGGSSMPAGFSPANPGDPHYNWGALDAEIRGASRWHLKAILTLLNAPNWAEGPHRPANPNITGSWDPNAAEFGAFALAAARRYSGHFPDPLNPAQMLPRVRYWEIWNEENLPLALAAPNLVGEYRSLLDDSYDAIKSVASDSIVSVGGLAPVSYLHPYSISPLAFAAQLMCLQRVGSAFRAARSCPQRARLDVLADHPYSLAATPTKHAYRYDDVLVGDMGKLSALLNAAQRLHTVIPRVRPKLWVTEWSWFTNPPNQLVGDSPTVAARYVAYSMYEMWRAGAQMVIWYFVRDAPGADNPANGAGGGIYTPSGRPKPSLSAFAFPMVAGVSHNRGFAWGRVPQPRRQRVDVERASGRAWQQVATTYTGTDGVFYVQFPAHGNARYRALVPGGPVSLAYDSTPIPPRRTHLFGTG